MPRVATVVPEETDLLCEGCGYTLNGLPESSNCPECGKAIAESLGVHRQRSSYEQAPSAGTFLQTTRQVLFSTRQFFRTLQTRTDVHTANSFARTHLIIASILFGSAAAGHLTWILAMTGSRVLSARPFLLSLAMLLMPAACFLLLSGLTRLAAWLSALEARYWGMRLPHQVVRRGMQYHSAHYLPVALLAAAVVWGYFAGVKLGLIQPMKYDDIYLYTLCGIVILSALYLFQTYWIAMRSMMFANR